MDHDTLQTILNAFAFLSSIVGLVGVVIAYKTLKEAGRQRAVQRLDEVADLVAQLRRFADNGGNTFEMRDAQRRLRQRSGRTGFGAVRKLAEAPLRVGDAQFVGLAVAAEAEVENALRSAE